MSKYPQFPMAVANAFGHSARVGRTASMAPIAKSSRHCKPMANVGPKGAWRPCMATTAKTSILPARDAYSSYARLSGAVPFRQTVATLAKCMRHATATSETKYNNNDVYIIYIIIIIISIIRY